MEYANESESTAAPISRTRCGENGGNWEVEEEMDVDEERKRNLCEFSYF